MGVRKELTFKKKLNSKSLWQKCAATL